MALSIGELTGYLDLDAGPFEKGIAKVFDSMGSKKWQVVGAAAGVAAGTALAAGLMTAANSEKATKKLAASLGLDPEEQAKAGATAGKLYAANYGASMEEVTGAVGAVMSSISGMRSASEADVQAMTAKVLDLAGAFDLDVGRAAQVAGQMITSGLAKDGTEAADLLTVALQKVPAAVREDILDATDEYGPFFSDLGISGEKAMGMLVAASEKGMYGIDKTGDALKEFGIRATDMSAASKVAYDAVGMDQEAMTGKLLAGGDTAATAFQDIVTAVQGIEDPVAQSQAALALFGTPLEDLSVSEIPKFLGSLTDAGNGLGEVGGKADEMGATLNGGAGAAMTTFQRTAETTLGSLGATILPILTPILEKMAEWAPVLGPVILALGAFAAIMWVVNAAMLASPLTWIILGIVALIAAIVLLVMNWDAVVAFITQIWNGYLTWLTSVMAGFLTWWDGVWQGFLGFLSDTWHNAGEGIKGFIDGWLGFFRDLPGNILSALGNLGTLLLDAGKNILDGFLKGLEDGFNAVKDFVGGIGTWIAENKGPKAYDLALLVPAGGWIMDGLESGIEGSLPSLQKTLGGVSSTIASGVTGGTVGLTGANTATAPATSGSSGFTQNNYITEASNVDEVVQKVWAKFQFKAQEAGVRVGV